MTLILLGALAVAVAVAIGIRIGNRKLEQARVDLARPTDPRLPH